MPRRGSKNEGRAVAYPMLRVQLDLKVAFPHADLNYAGGRLHSAHDEPAVVLRPAIDVATFWFQACHLWILRLDQRQANATNGTLYVQSPNTAVVGQDGESRWYDRGDLHRDFGPAVCSQHYWYKYNRGVLAASDANTFSSDAGTFSSDAGTFSSDAGVPVANTPVAPCASGARCPCARLVARTRVGLWAPDYTVQFACVYHTCAGEVLECPVDYDPAKSEQKSAGRAYFKFVDSNGSRLVSGGKWFDILKLECPR